MSPTSNRPPKSSPKKPVPLTGMQRWLCGVLGQTIPIRVLEYGAHLAVVIWTSLCLAAIVFTMGWLWRIPATLLLLASVTLYVALVRKGHALAKDPTEGLAWYQQPFWDGLLYAARSMKWTGYDSSVKGRVIIDRRNEPVSDAQLLKLPQLAECEVLDLEGSPITDCSLKTIAKMKGLCCLVIRDTEISDQGIDALIRRLPKLWIWY